MRTWTALALAAAFASVGCNPESGTGGDGGGDSGGDVGCTNGRHQCVDTQYQVCSGGRWQLADDCADTSDVCVAELGCVSCHPGIPFCDGDDSRTCGDDGESSELTETCATDLGVTCDERSGLCVSLCAQATAERSNIGCDYWAVDLDNAENRAPLLPDTAAREQFAVAVANLTLWYPSVVTVEKDQALVGEPHDVVPIDQFTVNPGALHIFNLDRWDVDGDNPPGHDTDPQTSLSRRVYHITSTVPVVAYQFNPINQAYSNGASILLPTTGLDVNYSVSTWPPNMPVATVVSEPNRTYVTIVATEDGTVVNVTPTDAIFAGVGQPAAGLLPVDAIAADVMTEFRLDRFDVLNLETVARLMPLPDLTGTTVAATRPVAVFTGQDLSSVSDDVHTPPDFVPGSLACCAEHMESQVPPTSSMGQRFVVTRSPVRSSPGFEEYDFYRIFSVRDGTHVTTSLTDAGLSAFDLGEGEWKDFAVQRGFTLYSEPTPVHVVQLLANRDMTYDWRVGGDAEMIYFPSVEQRRNTYIFCTGVGFDEDWAVVSIPQGQTALIDGEPLATACGSPRTDGELEGVNYVSYYCRIADGRHEVTSEGDVVVGVTVYGYYNAGSYGYPAGSNLRQIFFG